MCSRVCSWETGLQGTFCEGSSLSRCHGLGWVSLGLVVLEAETETVELVVGCF